MGKRKRKRASQPNRETQKLTLLAARSIYANGPVTEELAGAIVEEIKELIAKNPAAPIYLCINTEGGEESTARGFHNYVRSFLKLRQLVTVMLGPADRAASILWMSGNERIMASDQTLDIGCTEKLGFDQLDNHPTNGTDKPDGHPLSALIQAAGPITAEQAFEAGIATGLLR